MDLELGESRGFFFIGRGLFGMPVFLDGNIRLPDEARLKLQRREGYHEPHSQVALYSSNRTGGGVVFLVSMMASSKVNHYLEGEVSATIDGQEMLLSSGTEDYVRPPPRPACHCSVGAPPTLPIALLFVCARGH